MMDTPQRVDPNLDVSMFEDGLRETIPEKIQELNKKMDDLVDAHDKWLMAVADLRKAGKLDESGVYFWTLHAEIKFIEYDVCKKWLQYWLGLYDKLPGEKQKRIETSGNKKKTEFERELELEQAKKTPIDNFYVGQLRSSGSRLAGKCPFHEERTPSFFIFTNTNTWHCFGCGAGGDVISFVMKIQNINFKQALEFLR